MALDVQSTNDSQLTTGKQRFQEEREIELHDLNMVYAVYSILFNRYLRLAVHSHKAYIEGTPEYKELNQVLAELSAHRISQRVINKIRTIYISGEEGIQFTISVQKEAEKAARVLSDEFGELEVEKLVNSLYTSNIDDFDRFYELYKLSQVEDWDNPRNLLSRWNEYHIAKETLVEKGISEKNVMVVVRFFFDKEKSRLETQEAQELDPKLIEQ